MSDITEILLSKYYGFGENQDSNKFLSSHDGTYDPTKFERSSDSVDSTGLETTEEAFGRGTSSETAKEEIENSNAGNSIGNKIVRSSRAIPDDDTLDDDTEDDNRNEYETLLESTFPKKKRLSGDENKISDSRDILTPKIHKNEERDENSRNDSALGIFEEVLPDNVSEISSIPTKKKPKKKNLLTVASTFIPEPSKPSKKILPACDGIFLDMTNLSLTEFPGNVLTNFSNLRMLYLENNSLTRLPEQLFSSLRLLQWLDVRNNELTTLPSNIKYHNSLEMILLEGNLFQKLPLELCLISSLKGLQTSRNPLIFPPADIIALGFTATINFLRNEWNKSNPEEIVDPPEKDRRLKPSTILCSDPPTLRSIAKNSQLSETFSTDNLKGATKKISVREKGWNYKPSNRCKNRGVDEKLEWRLVWIAKVKEMLGKQAEKLQRVKDRDALNNWRRDRRSYEKSMNRAANRTEEDIPFAIDFEDMRGILKDRLKMPVRGFKSRKRGSVIPSNINEKMMELYESLNRFEKSRKLDSLSPRGERKLLENEIKKLSEVQDEIQYLMRYNEMTTEKFEGSDILPKTDVYKPPPSMIV